MTEKNTRDDRRTSGDEQRLHVILASSSPRRSQLLSDAGVRFIVRTPSSPVDERLSPDEAAVPEEAAKGLAQKKAGAVVQDLLAENKAGAYVVIGADTMVVHDGKIFGKPISLDDGRRMLSELSGDVHSVITAVSVWLVQTDGAEDVSLGYRTFADESKVYFKDLSDKEITAYLRSGESFDKAGAYAIQGKGADLVDRHEGAYDTIVGLPVQRLLDEFPDLIR